MIETNSESISIQESNDIGIIARLARKHIFKSLKSMKAGRLVVVDGLGTHVFGSDAVSPDLVASIRVRSDRFYQAIGSYGAVGAAESYIDNEWETPDLLSVIRVMAMNLSVIQDIDSGKSKAKEWFVRLIHFLHRNDVRQAKKNISAHYDLGNDFFELFLDRNMMYSAAVFAEEHISLEAASEAKLDAVCKKLELSPSDHLLEIGTGWGGMAIFAAKNYGCRVTTTTLSLQQYNYAKDWIQRENLQDRIEILLQDYRELEGTYDKLVSIEMIEAVGHQYYASYFRRCSSLLKPTGLMLIQSILMPDQRYERSKKSVDFIQKYIFPGGALPSVGAIVENLVQNTDMQLVRLDDMTRDYALTLAEWRNRFNARKENILAQGFDSRFLRIWDYYFCYCEAGFRERSITTAQFVISKPDYR